MLWTLPLWSRPLQFSNSWHFVCPGRHFVCPVPKEIHFFCHISLTSNRNYFLLSYIPDIKINSILLSSILGRQTATQCRQTATSFKNCNGRSHNSGRIFFFIILKGKIPNFVNILYCCGPSLYGRGSCSFQTHGTLSVLGGSLSAQGNSFFCHISLTSNRN